jgi:hypothetical protein
VTSDQQFGFRWHDDAIEMQLGKGASWQALTDRGALKVTRFEARLHTQWVASGDESCPPRQQVREISYAIEAQALSDAQVKRSLKGSMRLRNDVLAGPCPAAA